MEVLQQILHALAQAEPGEFWVAVLILAMFGIGLCAYGFVQLRRARMLEDTPTSRIRSAAQGYVELHGHARLLPGPEIRSPLSAERCCWWQYKIEQRRTGYRSGKRRTEWVVIDQGTSDELFLLADGTGECVVDPVGATVVPSVSRTWRGHHARPSGFPRDPGWLQFGDYRYTERLLNHGDWLYTLGLFQTQTAIRADDETRDVSHLLAEWKRDQRALLQRFDSNGDGRIDMHEWEQARRAAIEAVRNRHIEHVVQPDLHVLSKPRDRRPFILSTKTEHELTRGLRWGGWASVLSGPLLGGLAVSMLVARGLL